MYRCFVGKPLRKKLRGRPTYRGVDNIKIDIRLGSTGSKWLRIGTVGGHLRMR